MATSQASLILNNYVAAFYVATLKWAIRFQFDLKPKIAHQHHGVDKWPCHRNDSMCTKVRLNSGTN